MAVERGTRSKSLQLLAAAAAGCHPGAAEAPRRLPQGPLACAPAQPGLRLAAHHVAAREVGEKPPSGRAEGSGCERRAGAVRCVGDDDGDARTQGCETARRSAATVPMGGGDRRP